MAQMSRIELKDNSEKPLSLEDLTRDNENLAQIENKTIAELSAENPNLFVFPPQENSKTEDKIEDDFIIRTTRSRENKTTIKTGNIMGFFAINETEIFIRSRFDNAEKDFFLHYMLQKVCHVNLLNFPTGHERERVFDFLPFLFPYYLNRALKQGLYKEYQTFKRNDSNIRGTIDINRHIQKNIPFNGKIAYKTREHSYNNAITQLVRHTIEYLRGNAHFKFVLNKDDETKTAVAKIVDATNFYNHFERQKILTRTTKSIRSPFFEKYEELRKICRLILLHKKIRYENSKNKIYGILFDGAWLWEEYLWTLLKPRGNDIIHAQNKNGKAYIHPFTNKIRKFYPDFYSKENFVLDAKYKKIDAQNLGADDLQQIIAYMHVLNCSRGEFLFPSRETTNLRKLGDLCGNGGEVFMRALKIPQSTEKYENFLDEIHRSEKEFFDNF